MEISASPKYFKNQVQCNLMCPFSSSLSGLVITCNGVLIISMPQPVSNANTNHLQQQQRIILRFRNVMQWKWQIIGYEDVWCATASKFTDCNLFILHVFSSSILIKFNGNVEIFCAMLRQSGLYSMLGFIMGSMVIHRNQFNPNVWNAFAIRIVHKKEGGLLCHLGVGVQK